MRRRIDPIVNVLAAALLIPAAVAAQVLTADVCRFRGAGGEAFVELFVDLPRASVVHVSDSSGWIGVVNFAAEISEHGNLLAQDHWRLGDRTADTASVTGGQRIRDARTFKMPPGEYYISVTATDSISGSVWRSASPVEVEPDHPKRLTLSDIELASHLIPAGIMQQFDRGDIGLVPDPARLFGPGQPYFYYYIEIYPPDSAHSGDTITLQRSIRNGGGSKVAGFPPAKRAVTSPRLGDVDSISIAGLATGSYDFVLEAEYGGKQVSQRARFFIYGSSAPQAPVARSYDSVAVDAELHRIDFLLVNLKHKPLAQMSLPEKGEFLDQFWRRYDDDPSSPEVPARVLLESRVAEADERYSTARLAGHQTDRGRIYALYGEPDSRDRHSLESGGKPYEIWYYDRIQGGVSFVFVDRSGLGEYTLVHSDKVGEISNPDWYRQYVNRAATESGR